MVEHGAVEILASVNSGDVDRPVFTARAGGIFGWLSLIDEKERPGHARAIEKTRTLLLDGPAFERIEAEHPATYLKLVRFFLATMAGQVRGLVDYVNTSIEWGLEISGLAGLNLQNLVSEHADVQVELVNGTTLAGRLIKFEASAAGHELLLRAGDQLHMVPYASLVRITVAGGSDA